MKYKKRTCKIISFLIVLLVCLLLTQFIFRFKVGSDKSSGNAFTAAKESDITISKLENEKSTNEEVERGSIIHKFTNVTTQKKNQTCHIRNGVLSTFSLPITGLLSFPGSGNTWTRHLIQQLTGLATSSCYCDHTLQLYGFPFECHADKSRAIVTKTHNPQHVKKFKFERVVFLIRNPYDAFLSYTNWKRGGHTNNSQKSVLIKESVKGFEPSRAWYMKLVRFLKEFRGPVHIIQYEKLKSDMVSTLQNLSTFLNVSVSQRDIHCTVQLQDGNFHRKTDEQEHITLLREIFDKEKVMKLKKDVRLAEQLIKEISGLELDIGGRTECLMLHEVDHCL